MQGFVLKMVDKISINSELENIDLINEIAENYGSQSISIVLDYKRINQTYKIFTNCGNLKKDIPQRSFF